MVGGIVLGVAQNGEVTLINVGEVRNTAPGRPLTGQECAIRIRNGAAVRPGDSIWWQGSWAMWTPQENRGNHLRDLKCGKDYDIKLPRVGFSH